MSLKDRILMTNMFEDNEYLDKYCALMQENQSQKKVKYVTNRHHIIPKSYFRLIQAPIQDQDNTVNLKYSDHILAHYYLCLCSKDPDMKYCNQLAFMYLVDKTKSTDVRDFEKLSYDEEKLINDLEYYQQIYTEGAKTRGLKNTGKKRTEETKIKMSVWQKGKPKSPEARHNMSLAQKGHKQPETAIQKWRETMSHRTEEEKRVTSEKLSQKLKGRTVTDLARLHHSESLRGKPKSDNHRRHMSLAASKRIGEKSSNHILNEKDVVEIIKALNNNEMATTLAKKYNVSSGCIYDIKHIRSWKYVREKYPELNV